MRLAILASALACAALLHGCAAPNPERNFAPPSPLEPAVELTEPGEVLKALRAGGYVLYTRHGRTNRDELELEAKSRETGKFAIEDCATQRNLSAEGRAELAAAGEAFKRLKLPVTRFVTSRYCRVLQTAQAFTDRAAWSEALTSEGPVVKDPARIAGVRSLLSAPVAPKELVMLFAHQGIFYEATRLTVQEGWTVVLVPGTYTRVIARIGPQDWARLAAADQ